MTPTNQLTALHELAKSSPGGVEGCGWWPKCVTQIAGGYFVYRDGNSCIGTIQPQHALDLVTAEAKRWLGKQNYGQWERDNLGDDAEYFLRDYEFATLPEALAHAMNLERNEQC